MKKGSYIVVDGEPCVVLSNEHSKAGKHGHAKSRIVCVGLFDQKKRSLTMPADSPVDIPEIKKRTVTITYIEGETVGVMDSETYETFELPYPDDPDLKGGLEALKAEPEKMGEHQLEIWDILGSRVIKRLIRP